VFLPLKKGKELGRGIPSKKGRKLRGRGRITSEGGSIFYFVTELIGYYLLKI